jgi:hypothetical protein
VNPCFLSYLAVLRTAAYDKKNGEVGCCRVGGSWGDDGWVDDGDLNDLDAWAAGARAQDAAAARVRQRWLRQQAVEQADFVSLLVELRECVTPATVTTSGGRSHRGRITAVGRDCLMLVTTRGRTVVVAASAVLAVRPDEERPAALTVDTRPPGTESMAELVRRAAVDRPRVIVHAFGAAEPLVGELQACGLDVATLLLAGEQPEVAYLRLASVSEMSFDSG